MNQFDTPQYDDNAPISSSVLQRLGKLAERIRRLDQHLVEQMQHSVSQLAPGATQTKRTTVRPVLKGFLPWINQIAAMQGKGVNVSIDVDANVDILANQVGLYQQILYHLLQNAVTHGVETPDKRLSRGKAKKGEISIAFEAHDNGYCLTIKDDGNGMGQSVEQTANLPLPVNVSQDANGLFAQAENLAETGQAFTEASLGLGLHLVRRNVDLLQGEMDIETRAGRETIIKVIFPKH